MKFDIILKKIRFRVNRLQLKILSGSKRLYGDLAGSNDHIFNAALDTHVSLIATKCTLQEKVSTQYFS